MIHNPDKFVVKSAASGEGRREGGIGQPVTGGFLRRKQDRSTIIILKLIGTPYHSCDSVVLESKVDRPPIF